MGSLDVESLFSNVPVTQTIDIIIENVYNHPNKPALQVNKENLKKLLLICTTETPFKHINEGLYIQIDGVSRGSCLGPTFVEFYMCHLEKKVFAEQPSLKPNLYARCVDDIFVVIEDAYSIEQIKQAFESQSLHSFTHEGEKDKQ